MARRRFTFWLDDSKESEHDMADTIAELKRKRSFVTTVRQGIQLIVDLRKGSTDVLFELFPHLRPKVDIGLRAGGNDAGEFEDNLNAALKAQIERLEGILMQQATTSVATPVMKPIGAIGKGRHFSPIDDAPAAVVKEQKADTAQVSNNFFSSLSNLNA